MSQDINWTDQEVRDEHNKNQNKPRRSGIGGAFCAVFTCLALVSFALSAAVTIAYNQEYNRLKTMQDAVSAPGFYEGIRVMGQDVSGMEYDQALQLLSAQLEETDAKRVINVDVDGHTESLSIPASHNLEEKLIEAFNIGREGELEERYARIVELKNSPMDIEVSTEIDDSGVRAFVASIDKETRIEPVDAAVSDFDVETKTFSFTDEAGGRRLYAEHLSEQIDMMVKNDQYDRTLTAEFEELLPKVTKAQLESQNRQLASYSTTTTSNSNRNTNIQLCSSAFNGLVVAPGEVFSINQLTGPRTPAKGYKDAGTIRDGTLVDEPGGGVCQVSGTLFNAVVRAGMEIVERNPHSWPSDYVPIGMDAAIDYPAKDFKFRNVSDSPIYLVSIFKDRKLTVEVYGKPVLEEGITVELRSEVTGEIERGEDKYEFDSSLRPGQVVQLRKGRNGKNVNTYIRYMRGDALVEEKLLFKSVYPAIRAKYGYGPELPSET